MSTFKSNLAAAPKNYSTYVMLLVFGVATYWMQLPAGEQAALMSAYPWLKHAAPIAGLVTFLSRIWPQAHAQAQDAPEHSQ